MMPEPEPVSQDILYEILACLKLMEKRVIRFHDRMSEDTVAETLQHAAQAIHGMRDEINRMKASLGMRV